MAPPGFAIRVAVAVTSTPRTITPLIREILVVAAGRARSIERA